MTSPADGEQHDAGQGPPLRVELGAGHEPGPGLTIRVTPGATTEVVAAIGAAVAAAEAAATGLRADGAARVSDVDAPRPARPPSADDAASSGSRADAASPPSQGAAGSPRVVRVSLPVSPSARSAGNAGPSAAAGCAAAGTDASGAPHASPHAPSPAELRALHAPGPPPPPRDVDLDTIRPDLAEVHRRRARTLDDARPDAVQRRHARGRRTARQNVEDLVDPGTFVEYGALAVAAQRTRRPLEDLIDRTPADGLVSGVADVNGEVVGHDRAATVVCAYDATVLAGTQGVRNHAKTDRMFQLARQRGLPVVLFAEGGGGRPGDVDVPTGAWLDVPTFHAFAGLSGVVPLVGVVAGRCFAGNAALLGCCDVVIATEDSTIGMGGPAMIEGGGLGVHAPDDVGPITVQAENGVVDVVVADEAEAVDVARRCLGYLQGPARRWAAPDARLLRHAVPESRTRAYDVRRVLHGLADVDSVLELRHAFGTSMVTALVRVEGRPYGVLANDPSRLGGAIDSDAADKAARFLGFCEAHRLPVISLCDTPGFMVGPESEATGAVRHVSRMFVVGAKLTVPLVTIVLRKAYGLGAMAMAGGHLRVPLATVGWPTSELGPMGLEGAVRLGFRDELAAATQGEEREALFRRMVDAAYDVGRGLHAATAFELDDVIDPMETRRWIVSALGDAPGPRDAAERRAAPPGRWVDTW